MKNPDVEALFAKKMGSPTQDMGTKLFGESFPDYAGIGDYGRRTGIRVKLCDEPPGHPLPRKSTKADQNIHPPGWPIAHRDSPTGWPRGNPTTNNTSMFNRGHLLGALLGGSNSDPRNFITQFEHSNNDLQRPIEKVLNKTLESDGTEQIYYFVISVYSDDLPTWTQGSDLVNGGAGGYSIDACIPNTQNKGSQVSYGDPCLV